MKNFIPATLRTAKAKSNEKRPHIILDFALLPCEGPTLFELTDYQMSTLKFAVLPGDGIGPEVMNVALNVLKVVAEKHQFELAIQQAESHLRKLQ